MLIIRLVLIHVRTKQAELKTIGMFLYYREQSNKICLGDICCGTMFYNITNINSLQVKLSLVTSEENILPMCKSY